jgi:hypothetical protein
MRRSRLARAARPASRRGSAVPAGGCAATACAVAVGGPARAAASGPGAATGVAFGRGPPRPVARRGPPPGFAVPAAPAGGPEAIARAARPGSVGPSRLITRARSRGAAFSGRPVVSARRAVGRAPGVLAGVKRAWLSRRAAAGRRPWRRVLGLRASPTADSPADGAAPAVLARSRTTALGRAACRAPAATSGGARGLGAARTRAARGPCPARRPRVPAARAPALGRSGSLSHVHQPPASTLPRQAKRAARPFRERPSSSMSGGVLLSHAVPRAVPSALKGLTSGFGMGPGVSPSL